jgi:hypothetical protein
MRLHAFFISVLFLNHQIFAADFNLPTGLSPADIPTIAQSFTSGFLTRTPVSLLGQNKYNSEVGIRVNSIDTGKVAKLGNRSKDEEVHIQEFSFSKQLPLDIELGIQSSLSMFDRDISTFGGYGRWGFYLFSWGGLSLVGHGTSANYKNLVGTNLYGGLLNIDMNVAMFHLSLGTGFLRSTSSFDPSLFIGYTGLPEASKTYGRIYGHQSVKLSYLWNNLSFSAQGDWLKDFFSSATIAYLF